MLRLEVLPLEQHLLLLGRQNLRRPEYLLQNAPVILLCSLVSCQMFEHRFHLANLLIIRLYIPWGNQTWQREIAIINGH